MKKKLYFAMLLLAAAAIGMGFTSCGDDDDDDNEVWTPGGESGSDTDISRVVSQNMSATASYGYCSWDIDITTKLASKYPRKSISYGIEIGYNGYQYYIEAEGSGESYYVEAPLFISGSKYAEEALEWKMYVALKKKENYQTLTANEKNFIKESEKFFNKSESAAKSSYQCRAYAEIDGKRYYVDVYL